MKTSRIDHLVLTVADIERSVGFYRDVLGRRRIESGGGHELRRGRPIALSARGYEDFALEVLDALDGV